MQAVQELLMAGPIRVPLEKAPPRGDEDQGAPAFTEEEEVSLEREYLHAWQFYYDQSKAACREDAKHVNVRGAEVRQILEAPEAHLRGALIQRRHALVMDILQWAMLDFLFAAVEVQTGTHARDVQVRSPWLGALRP